MTRTQLLDFKATAKQLHGQELFAAYKALNATNAPMPCFTILIDLLLEEYTEQEIDAFIDTL